MVAGAGTTTAQGAGSSTFVWNESSGSLPNGGRWEYYDDGVNWWYYEYDDQNNMTLEKSGTYTSTMQAAFFRSAAAYYAQNPEEYARLLRRSDRNKVRQAFYDMTRPEGAGGGLGSSSSSATEITVDIKPPARPTVTPLNAFIAFFQIVAGTFQVTAQTPTTTQNQATAHDPTLDNPPDDIRSGNWFDDEIVYWRREDGTMHAYYDSGSGNKLEYIGELRYRNGEEYIVRNGHWARLDRIPVGEWFTSIKSAKDWDEWFKDKPTSFTRDAAQRQRAMAYDVGLRHEVTEGGQKVGEAVAFLAGAQAGIDTLGMGLIGELKMAAIPWGTGVKVLAKGGKLFFKFAKKVGGKVVNIFVEVGGDKLDDFAKALGHNPGTKSAQELAEELVALERLAKEGDQAAIAALETLSGKATSSGGRGLIGLVKPGGTIDDALRAHYIEIAQSPQMAAAIERYNKIARFLGQKPSASIDDIVKALGDEVTFSKVGHIRSGVFTPGSHPGTTNFWIQGNPTTAYGRRVGRHELTHLGAALNGQGDNFLHEIAVQAATTPEILVFGVGSLVVVGGTVYWVSGQ